ncbi:MULTISPECIES: hypothetical protein [Pseudomonas]|jgi:hypothetical protein|uniref:hypothetical protein n=1 Tax=Pseudomonas TaxID=286 RepID=UPI0002F91AD8|nr:MULTISPECIES: hypothetical protein [Pseudomonas]MDR6928724.1 hypothetical protein [Pseudomonas sp. BE134]MDR7284377.1 hypothetical protein [Pseudomonas corrugata]
MKAHFCIWNVSTQPQRIPSICNANRVAAAEQREAAFGCAAVVNPQRTVSLTHRIG